MNYNLSKCQRPIIIFDKEQTPVEKEFFKRAELYCVHCGNKGLLQEKGDGDYYAGPDLKCPMCNKEFNLPFIETFEDLEEA